jgi:hypothetical protein
MVHTRFNTQEDSLQVVNTKPIDTPKIYSRVDKIGRLLTVDKSTNNLTVTNFKDGKVLKKYPGNLEEAYRFDEFRPLRYSKEDSNPLWRRGLDSIVLLDPDTLEVKAEYPNFWA